MEAGEPSDRGADRTGKETRIPILTLVFLSALYLLFLILAAVLGSDWSSFKLVYMFWFLTYVGATFLLIRSPLIKRLEKIGPVWTTVIIFAATFLLHLPFLLGNASLSQDILRLEKRGELLMDGRFPYRDFDVNKPPLYIWMVGLLSLPFGPNQMVFRFVFSVANSLVPVVMFLVHRRSSAGMGIFGDGPFGTRLPGFNWMTAAIAYSLCPVPLMETGMGGHFDPIVVLATMISFLFLVKKRPVLCGLFLGAGFALKVYPMFLAPVFFLSVERWSDRMKFTGSFFLIPVLASLPILFVDPSLMGEYLEYQFVSWYSGFSIRYLLELVFSEVGIPEKAAYYLLTLTLLFGSAYLLLRGYMGKFKRVDTSFVFGLILVLSVVGAVLSSIFFFRGAETSLDRISAYLSVIFSLLMISGGLYLFLHWRPFGRPYFKGLSLRTILTGEIKFEWVPLISSCILLLVIVTSAQFHPWYLPWVLPFALASGSPYWSWSTLLLMASLQYNYYPPWEFGGF